MKIENLDYSILIEEQQGKIMETIKNEMILKTYVRQLEDALKTAQEQITSLQSQIDNPQEPSDPEV